MASQTVQRFFEQLLRTGAGSIEDGAASLCTHWLEATSATWTCLWMFNPFVDQYELTSFKVRNKNDELDREIRKLERNIGQKNGIGYYCSLSGRAITTNDIVGWRREHDGSSYRIVLSAELRNLCRGLQAAPLTPPPLVPDSDIKYCPILFSYHEECVDKDLLGEEDLLAMGRASAQFLESVQRSEEASVQVDINALARRYLPTTSPEPIKQRRDFLNEVIGLIQKRISVKGVSIFQRNKLEDVIQLIATTGISDETGPIAPEDYPGVSYRFDEGWTGECFTAARPILSQSRRKDPKHPHKYYEMRSRGDINPQSDPILLYPIPNCEKPGPGIPESMGVVRCVEHHSRMFGEVCQFKPSELRTLHYLLRQIGPLLEALTARIEREAVISIVKHDLAAPITMIQLMSERIVHEVRAETRPRENDCENLAAAATLAKNLVPQLGLAPAKTNSQARQPTFLVGDVIARLANMLRPYATLSAQMNIHFDDESFRSIPKLRLNREAVERVFHNLIVNAIKYGKPNTAISINALPKNNNPNYHVVDVQNFGIEIREQDKDKIFLPGYRSPEARTNTKPGVGLGLAIARQIMNDHEGDIFVTSRGQPTVFSLYFPKSLRARER